MQQVDAYYMHVHGLHMMLVMLIMYRYKNIAIYGDHLMIFRYIMHDTDGLRQRITWRPILL